MYPCTVNEESWTWDVSICSLFGHLCSGNVFSHDSEMGLIKGGKVASRKTKRRRGKSSSQVYSGNSAEENTDSDDEHDQDTAQVNSARSNGTQNSASAISRLQQRRLKRPRASREPSSDSMRCASPRMISSSTSVSTDGFRASQRCISAPRKIDDSRITVLSNDPLPEHKLNDIRGSFQGWLRVEGSKTKPLAQGVLNPIYQFMSETSTAAYQSLGNIGVSLGDLGSSVEPSSNGRSQRQEYRCRWQTCSEAFNLQSNLRQHVVLNHQSNGHSGQHLGYVCFWGQCSRPNAPAFSTLASWIDHLDIFHLLNGLPMPIKTEKVDRRAGTDAKQSRDHASGPLTDGADDREDPSSERLQSHAGIQAYPTSLSSLGISSSTIASHLSPTNYHNIDNYEPTPSNERALESQETQLSVSTSIFKSQPSDQPDTQDRQHTAEDHHPNTEIHPIKTEYRIDAYRATKGTTGLGWHGVELVSSSGGHGELEMEL